MLPNGPITINMKKVLSSGSSLIFFLIIWYLLIHAHQIFCNVYFKCGGFIYLYAESLLLQKRVKLPLRNRCLVSISRTRAVAPTLFAQTGIPNGKPNNVKVFRLLKLKVGTSKFGSAYSWYGNSILIPWFSVLQVLCSQVREIPVVEGRYGICKC